MSDSASVRRFRWKDIDALTPVFNAATGRAGADGAADAELLRQMLSLPACDAERDCHVAYRDGALVGFSLVSARDPDRPGGDQRGVTEPHRGRASAGRCCDRPWDAPTRIGASVAHVQVAETADEARRLLESERFGLARRYLDLVWSEAPIPLPEVDAGYTVRCFESGDEPALTELQNACFTGSWGFCPNTVEEVAAKLAFGTSFPCGIVFVEYGARPVAYAWTFMSGATGWIGMTGVHPDYRGRGLGKAALAAGMTYLAETGRRRCGWRWTKPTRPLNGCTSRPASARRGCRCGTSGRGP